MYFYSYFEYYKEMIEKFVKEYCDGVVIDYYLNKINKQKSHFLPNVTSLETFAEILDNHYARRRDKSNNCTDLFTGLKGLYSSFKK